MLRWFFSWLCMFEIFSCLLYEDKIRPISGMPLTSLCHIFLFHFWSGSILQLIVLKGQPKLLCNTKWLGKYWGYVSGIIKQFSQAMSGATWYLWNYWLSPHINARKKRILCESVACTICHPCRLYG